MRWRDQSLVPYGTIRYRKRFLFAPKRLDGEWVWLETVYIKQSAGAGYIELPFGGRRQNWHDIEFTDVKEGNVHGD